MTSLIPRLLVIGGGNMATAILEGACSCGVVAPGDVWVAEPDDGRRGAISARCGRVFESAREAVAALAEVEDGVRAEWLLAVKPQVLPAVATDLAGSGAPLAGRRIISILAGATRARLAEAIGEGPQYIRVMPNTPARIGRGMTAIATASDLTGEGLDLTRRIFGAVGQVIEIDEALMDGFTAVAGSGPAYVFLLAEALAEAAQAVGFDPSQAEQVSRATVCGAAALLESASQPAGELRQAVTSKGGTTEAALGVLTERGFAAVLRDAVIAARDRGRELSNRL